MKKTKKMKWSLVTMLTSWVELISIVFMLYCAVSYVDVLARHSNCAEWNLFNVMIEMGENR